MGRFPFAATDDDDLEVALVDVGIARAFWEGVPTARLLARIRLDRDERDLVDVDQRASGAEFPDSTWDTLLAPLVGHSPVSHERVKRGVTRHTRTAQGEGRLAANDATIAALVHALLSASDADASPAECAADAHPVEELVRRAAASFDERLGSTKPEIRATAFEACLALATRAVVGPYAWADLLAALGPDALVPAGSPLYPWGDADVPVALRRACLLERSDLERHLAGGAPAARSRPYGTLLADVTGLLARRGNVVLVTTRAPRSRGGAYAVPPSSWLPADLGSPDAAARLAAALERGDTTVPRARAIVLGGGEVALDAIGAEMLDVTAHPFASAAFAEILAHSARERDAIRLVTYFAIAPDPAAAAYALSLSPSRELPGLIRNWLETTLPADGQLAPFGSDPETSASAHLRACVAALAPYPHLYAAAAPLLSRVSDVPPA